MGDIYAELRKRESYDSPTAETEKSCIDTTVGYF